MANIDEILKKQREFFFSGATLRVAFRIQALKKLKEAIKDSENEINQAVKADLGKSYYESYMCETGLALSEISYLIKHAKSFSKEKKVKTPLAQFASRSFVKPVPYGNVLIMSPWNYPFLLAIEPLADAICAGNTAILKPSAYSPNTSLVIAKIVEKCFPSEFVAVVLGGRKENAELLDKKFDMIFFTGSQSVGKEVLLHASKTLTPTVLELGGKSPCIVDRSANIKLSAKRIVFGKFLNCGQTCVAPDYILCDKSIKSQLVSEIILQIKKQFGKNPLDNPDYGKIVNGKHFERINSLIVKEKVVYGGKSDKESNKIEPTVLDGVTWEDAVMNEEIFGPLLPVLTYDNFDDIFSLLYGKQKPLALYLFSRDKAHIKKATAHLRYGGGCINDVVIHLANSEMGFGGVGESGMGAYHGKVGFDAFSHRKSIVDKKNFIDLPMRYQPYKSKFYNKLLHLFLK